MNKINRVLFVDFDGVLNDPAFLTDHEHKSSLDSLDPHRIALLSHLCTTTGAKVVLTSSWRDDLKARDYLKRSGVPVIGATPHSRDRGQGIRQWVLDKKFTGSYVILDDECSELNSTQLTRLVCTREGNNLGLSYRHILFTQALFRENTPNEWANSGFIKVILQGIEEEWLRVMWNIHQKDYEDESPFRNTGNVPGYKNDTFEVHAYDWTWDSDTCDTPEPYNFKWQDLKIYWYKWFGRGIYTSRPVTHDELAVMLEECLTSLQEEEKKYE